MHLDHVTCRRYQVPGTQCQVPQLLARDCHKTYQGIIGDITRYGRFSEKIDFLDYTALGRVWCGAKYSHRVWEQFAHTFEKSYFLLKSRSVNYLFMSIFWLLERNGSVGTLQNQLFHHQTVLEQCKTNCSITRQCWNRAKPIVPSPDSAGTVQNQLFQHLPKPFPKV